jgi:hypothetical protein
MSKHTPGPWRSDEHFACHSMIMAGDEVLAQTDCKRGAALGTDRANARLIAAAPDMLAALKAWEHWYSEDSSEFNRDGAREMGLALIRNHQ